MLVVNTIKFKYKKNILGKERVNVKRTFLKNKQIKKNALFIKKAWIAIFRWSSVTRSDHMHEIRTIWLANFWERVNYKAKFETGGGREGNKVHFLHTFYEIQSDLFL